MLTCVFNATVETVVSGACSWEEGGNAIIIHREPAITPGGNKIQLLTETFTTNWTHFPCYNCLLCYLHVIGQQPHIRSGCS